MRQQKKKALNTILIAARVYHTRQDPNCRLCKDTPDTMQHITAEGKKQTIKAYLECHNQAMVYRNICVDYELVVPVSKWTKVPKVI